MTRGDDWTGSGGPEGENCNGRRQGLGGLVFTHENTSKKTESSGFESTGGGCHHRDNINDDWPISLQLPCDTVGPNLGGDFVRYLCESLPQRAKKILKAQVRGRWGEQPATTMSAY